MGDLHPSSTARQGNIPSTAITKGRHRDLGPFPAAKEVWCRQCGFRCNLQRDARGINEFAGETIEQGLLITDHDYDDGHTDDHDYDGSGRTTSSLSEELTNGSFEDFTAGNPDGWTVSQSNALWSTVTQATTAGYYDNDGGVSSVKITKTYDYPDAEDTVQLSQSASTPSDFNNNILRFRARVKSNTNGVIRVRVLMNSVNYYSSWNIAQQNFQEMQLLIKCPASVSSLTVYIQAYYKAGTAYVDSVKLARSGNPTTANVGSGCPHCGSYDYF